MNEQNADYGSVDRCLMALGDLWFTLGEVTHTSRLRRWWPWLGDGLMELFVDKAGECYRAARERRAQIDGSETV